MGETGAPRRRTSARVVHQALAPWALATEALTVGALLPDLPEADPLGTVACWELWHPTAISEIATAAPMAVAARMADSLEWQPMTYLLDAESRCGVGTEMMWA